MGSYSSCWLMVFELWEWPWSILSSYSAPPIQADQWVCFDQENDKKSLIYLACWIQKDFLIEGCVTWLSLFGALSSSFGSVPWPQLFFWSLLWHVICLWLWFLLVPCQGHIRFTRLFFIFPGSVLTSWLILDICLQRINCAIMAVCY